MGHKTTAGRRDRTDAALERRDERGSRALLRAELDDLLRDFADRPEQIARYLAEQEEAGRLGPQEVLAAHAHLAGLAGAEWADRALGRDGDGETPTAPPATVERALRDSAGTPLPPRARARLERSYGADLGGVRIHTGAASDEAARTLGAAGFAIGEDVHLAAGRYDPDGDEGFALLAHEVAHTIQSATGPPPRDTAIGVGAVDAREERAADEAAWAAGRGAPAFLQPSAAGSAAQIRRVPYNAVPVPGRPGEYEDPEQVAPDTLLVRPEDQGRWDGRRILRGLTQLDASGATSADAQRCGPTSLIAVHVMTGREAVQRVASDTRQRLHVLQRHSARFDAGLLRYADQLRQRLARLSGPGSFASATYGDLGQLGEALYLLANLGELNRTVRAAPGDRDPNVLSTTPREMESITELGHSGVESEEEWEWRLSQRPGEQRGAHGQAAAEHLPATGERNGLGDLRTVVSALRRHRNVGLTVAVRAPGGAAGTTGHGVTLGVDSRGRVYLYDPWPRSGSQTLYYGDDDATVPAPFREYFSGPWAIVAQVAGADESARRLPQE